MKKVLITENCKYAQHRPSMPILEFIENETYDLEDSLADSVIKNNHGMLDEPDETLSDFEGNSDDKINPEIKEKPRRGRRPKKENES